MTIEKANEIKKRPINLSDIPEITPEQFKDFYPRRLRLQFMQLMSLLDKENINWLSNYGSEYKTKINEALTNVRLAVNNI